MVSSFIRVCRMNELFGNPAGGAEVNWERIESQCKALKAEYKELMDAIAEKDLYKTRDALCDMHVYLYGAHHLMGIDADADMSEVIDAVLTRFCKTPDQLQRTSAHYDALGVSYYIEGDYPYVRLKSSFDQGDGEYPKGKFLKCVDHREPNLV